MRRATRGGRLGGLKRLSADEVFLTIGTQLNGQRISRLKRLSADEVFLTGAPIFDYANHGEVGLKRLSADEVFLTAHKAAKEGGDLAAVSQTPFG